MGQTRRVFSTPVEQFDLLHGQAHGTVLLWDKLSPGKAWKKLQPSQGDVTAILAAQSGLQDRYVSVNEFYGWRRVNLLKSLRAFYADVDGITDLDLVLGAVQSAGLPQPTVVVFSGRGIHLYWLIEPVPPKALPMWQLVENRIIKLLSGTLGVASEDAGGVDAACSDCTRVLRLVGTVNSKNGRMAHGMHVSEKRWTLHELSDAILGEKRGKKPQEKKPAAIRSLDAKRAEKGAKKQQGVFASKSIGSWWWHVYQDCHSIAARHPAGIPEGHRDKFLFIASCALAWYAPPEVLLDEIARLAVRMTPTLNYAHAVAAMQPVVDRAYKASRGEKVQFGDQQRDARYFFRRQTLLEWLSPIIPADLYPKLRAIVPDEVLHQHKRETDRASQEKRYRDKNTGRGVRSGNVEKMAAAREMHKNGRTCREIAGELGVSRQTVVRWCN